MAKFKVGDKVRRGVQIGVVRDVEKEPYIEVKFTNEPVAVFVHEDELAVANSCRSANAVVAKALNSARNADLSAVLRDLKPKFEKYERECRQIAKALRALPKGPDRARKAESLMPKVRELYQDGAIGEMTRPLSAFADPEAAQIRISHERSMGEAKRELWGALRDAGLLAQATNSATDGVYEKAINDATGRTFKAGDKVRWEYVGGETDSGVVIADKGSYLEVKTDSGEVAHPAKILIAKNACAANAKFKSGDTVKHKTNGLTGIVEGWASEPGNVNVRSGGRVYMWDEDDLVLVKKARSRNAVVQKAINAKARNDWVKSNRSALGYQWRETAKERGIKSALRSTGAKSVDYLPWNHGTVKAGNYDTLSWVVEAPEEDIDAVAAKMKQLGLVDISKPSLADYGNFSVVGYQKIAPIPDAKNAVKNATTPAVGSRWVHNDDNLFIVKVIGADGSSVRVQSADGGTCTYRLDEFLSDYRAANACKNAAAPSAELRRAYDDWQKAKAKFAKWWNPDRRLSERPPAGADEAQKAVAFSDLFLKEVGRRPPNGYGKMTLEQMLAK